MKSGYNEQWPKAMLMKPEEVERPINQPNTRAWQEVLARARSWWWVSCDRQGARHIRSNDLFISSEMADQNDERMTVKKERNLCPIPILQANEERALATVNQGKPVNLPAVTDHDVLIHGIRHLLQRVQKRWTHCNSGWWSWQMASNLLCTRGKQMKMKKGFLFSRKTSWVSNTSYGRKVVLKMRYFEAVTDKFI